MIEHMEAVVFEDGKVTEKTMCEFCEKMNDVIDELNKQNEKKPVKKEPKYYNGRVLCVGSKALSFTVGKIYPCINGRLIDDAKDIHNPYCFGLESFEELSKAVTYVKFVEITGEVKIDE